MYQEVVSDLFMNTETVGTLRKPTFKEVLELIE